MARTPYKTPEAERIFAQNDVANRMAGPYAAMPDSQLIEYTQQMQDRLAVQNNQIKTGPKKAPV